MHLRGVTGGIYERDGVCTQVVSTIGGKHKDHIRLESTESQEFSPQNRNACFAQYNRWKSAVQKAAIAQNTDAPGQRVLVSLGMQFNEKMAQVAAHIIDAELETIAAEFSQVAPRIQEMRAMTIEDVYATLKQLIVMDLERPVPNSASLEFTMPTFSTVEVGSLDGMITDVPIPEKIQYHIKMAERGNAQSMQVLRQFAESRGFEWAKAHGKALPEDLQFLQIVETTSFNSQVMRLFDLRQYFGKGMREALGWTHFFCVKFNGDKKSPPFVDITVANLAKQLSDITGKHDSSIVMLKQ